MEEVLVAVKLELQLVLGALVEEELILIQLLEDLAHQVKDLPEVMEVELNPVEEEVHLKLAILTEEVTAVMENSQV